MMLRGKKLLYHLLAFATIISMMPLSFPKDVQAANAASWQAGSIIDDAVFTDKSSMSVQQIQDFLNSKVGTGYYGKSAGRCDTYGQATSEYGGGTRAQWAATRGYSTTFTCLKDYYEVPKTSPGLTIPLNNYGGKPIPEGALSAAQLIYNAAQTHSISPKVLLVTLHKESAGPLTTDDWPLEKQFTYAMGAHCPDSGPGGTANCDQNYAGFSIQISESAALLRWYIDSMAKPWWSYKKPYQTNSVLWNVETTGCGSGDVYISGKATAALYTYTPYQPNAAALANLYGTGDGCSAYGNRNFWRTYVDWFGPTTTVPYAWLFSSETIFADEAHTQPLVTRGGRISVLPGQKVYVHLNVYNNGNKAWSNSTVRLGTIAPQDRCSVFADTSWLSCYRIKMNESTVSPIGEGTFDFSITAPKNVGTYNERLSLVADGTTWMNDPVFYLPIDVINPQSSDSANQIQMDVDEPLLPGSYLTSSDSHSILMLQKDGNLVLYQDFMPVWSNRISNANVKQLILQGDGNLVEYASDGTALWSSKTAGNTAGKLTIQIDGNVVVYDATNKPLWSTDTDATPDHLSHLNHILPPGGVLYPKQSIGTTYQNYKLILQTDGNLVLYNDAKAIWSSKTYGQSISYLRMQEDGNLILFRSNGSVAWSSGSARGIAHLLLQDDGNLVVYNKFNQAVWSSGTAKPLN